MKEIKRIVEQVTAAFDRLNKDHAGARLLRFCFGFPANRISEVRAIIDPTTPESPTR